MTGQLVHLRRHGVSVLLDVAGPGVPALLHWGRDLGTDLPVREAWVPPVPHGTVDEPIPTTLLGGGMASPGLRGSRAGQAWAPRWTVDDVARPDDSSVAVRCTDAANGLTVSTTLVLDAHGVLTVGHVLRNESPDRYQLDRVAVVLPVPHRATELLDMTGRWARERHPQRHQFTAQGTWLRESRSGRTGHDATLLLVAGTDGFGNGRGEVWGAHLAWSG
ncbi:MAG TPA: glycoside hydrolase family 36 N-terminal domain-containing protein, partial [Actinomycetes bacterium]